MSKWYAYVILCDDDSLYKGHTNNLERRYAEHKSGNGANHTKLHKPIKIVYYEIFETMSEAVKREKYFKTASGREWIKSKIQEANQ